MNTQRLLGGIGILRILTLILNVVIMILMGLSHYHDLKEQFFFSIVAIILFLSCMLLVILVLDILQPVLANSLDMSFHLIGGLILLLATGLMIYSVFKIGDQCYFVEKIGHPCSNPPIIPRVALVILSVINGIIYIMAGILIKRTEYF